VKRRSASRRALPASRRWLAVVLCLAIGSAAAAALAAGDAGVLGLAPALLIALLVCRRRYPGANLLVAMRSRALRRQPRRGLAPLAAAARALTVAPRGGLLLACSLAVRPPPGALPAS